MCSVCWSRSAPQGLPAGVIAERLGVLPSSLTFHLNLLHRAGLITPAAPEPAADLLGRIRRDDRTAWPTSPKIAAAAGNPARPACNPADAFTTGESDEAVARARVG